MATVVIDGIVWAQDVAQGKDSPGVTPITL